MKRFLFLFIGLGIIFGCSKKEDVVFVGQGQDVFYAYLELEDESESDTKTYLGENNKLLWTADDRISIFVGNTYNQEFSFAGETGDNGGKFSMVEEVYGDGVDLDRHYAYYPFSSGTSISSAGVISSVLPLTQNYAPESFGLGASPMAAVTQGLDEFDLKFKNICGWLKLQLTGTASIKKITLVSGSSTVKLSGAATTSFIDGIPYVTMASDANDRVVLDCGAGVELNSSTSTSFFIAVPPCTLSNGFTVVIEDTSNGYMTKSATKSFTIERNKISPMTSFAYSAVEEVRPVVVEDEEFSSFLAANFDTDGDGAITTAEAAQITRIDFASPSASPSSSPSSLPSSLPSSSPLGTDARGYNAHSDRPDGFTSGEPVISDRVLDFSPFTALRYLDCRGQSLSSINVSNCPLLEYLYCGYRYINDEYVDNQLTSLDVSNNTALELLYCYGNQLTSLDVGNKPNLDYLNCFFNQLTTLDVRNSPILSSLDCSYNQLTSLGVSNNPNLVSLNCSSNQLTSLDVCNNTALESLICFGNKLTSLDVSNNPNLWTFTCNENQLTVLDITHLRNLGYYCSTGNQKNSSGEDIYITLFLTEDQKTNKWIPIWSGQYGNERVNLCTDAVFTADATNITCTSAVSGGWVTGAVGDDVTARGVCWSTGANPTISGNKTSDGTGTGAFKSQITGLTAGTKYYVRAYAVSSEGTFYGSVKSFTTATSETDNGLDDFIDDDWNW